jgi:hypothetical protein
MKEKNSCKKGIMRYLLPLAVGMVAVIFSVTVCSGEFGFAAAPVTINWGKLLSACYDRSDLAGHYYNQHVFQGKT